MSKIINFMDYQNKHEITCPYCGYEFDESWDISLYHNDGKTECGDCGKVFGWEKYEEVTYNMKKIDQPKKG